MVTGERTLGISEAAGELGVSRQTVYNWIDRIGKEIDQYIYKGDGPWLIDIEGLELIKQAMTDKEAFTREEGRDQGYQADWCENVR